MRQVVESERFGRERDEIASNIKRWDQVMRGVWWGLSRAPQELGKATHNPDVLVHITHSWPGAPNLAIYYSFDERQVTLLSVIVAEAVEG